MRPSLLRATSWLLGIVPTGAGEFRVGRALVARSAGTPPREQTLRGGARLLLDVHDHTQGVAFFTRRYEPHVVAFVASRLPTGGLFVDVGANVGLISTAVATRCPGTRVVAFEASPRNAARLRHNLGLNGIAADVQESAVCDRVGTAGFLFEAESGWGRLDPDGAAGTGTVATTTLDAYAADHDVAVIDVLKLDVEGAEGAVLDGASGLLSRGAIRCIVTEAHNETRAEHEARLEPYGFCCIDLDPVGLQRLTRRPYGEVAFVRDGD